ncbi:MAG: prepilin-type N-terminal cleavage/methylation domain-containing protein [Pseudomonadota bacterium]|nr:prepilin-type N-terminal cleavage/methylation domain-containing protein [Pseudomonadota bacterium]
MKRRQLSQRGFSLLEMAIVIGIIALIIGGIWLAYAAVTSNKREADANGQVLTIAHNMRNLYVNQNGGDGASMANLIAAGIFPGNMVSGTTVTNPWNGTVTITVPNGGTTFTIIYNGVPEKSCIELVSTNAFEPTEVGMTLMQVGSATVTLPASPVAADTACASGVTGNSLRWTFTLRG